MVVNIMNCFNTNFRDYKSEIKKVMRGLASAPPLYCGYESDEFGSTLKIQISMKLLNGRVEIITVYSRHIELLRRKFTMS